MSTPASIRLSLIDELLMDSLIRSTDDLEQLREIAIELLERTRQAEPAGVFFDRASGELRTPVATSIDFVPAVLPPHADRFSPVPALVVSLRHPKVPRATHFVLQVLPDLTRLDVQNRFADAVRAARLKAPS
jgi:hypothetical protein